MSQETAIQIIDLNYSKHNTDPQFKDFLDRKNSYENKKEIRKQEVVID